MYSVAKNSFNYNSKSGFSQYNTTDDESFVRTDEEIDDIDDDEWNISPKLWSYINR